MSQEDPLYKTLLNNKSKYSFITKIIKDPFVKAILVETTNGKYWFTDNYLKLKINNAKGCRPVVNGKPITVVFEVGHGEKTMATTTEDLPYLVKLALDKLKEEIILKNSITKPKIETGIEYVVEKDDEYFIRGDDAGFGIFGSLENAWKTSNYDEAENIRIIYGGDRVIDKLKAFK